MLRLTAIFGLVSLAASGQVIKDQPLPLPGGANQPGDAAAAVQFLCSDEANYITGHVLDVNGGMYMR